ncbi:LOW QUALITY PROTEIN: uncharacterized protein [Amphiura filiformis]|uniref:LOW QUALITY PROTEIN: uncharacterized protein n=1 Tax=Amphiura filiformis TaxID=82378 RepID=UPI003B21DC78
MRGNLSTPKPVLSGVPQGTAFGPLLFLLFINDLPDNIQNNVRLFADDCLVYSNISSEEDMDSLQDDLKQLEKWQSTWKMSFNPTKCSIMEISHKKQPPHRDYIFCGQKLQVPNSHPYLGVQLDDKLNWAEQVDNTVKKANRTMGMIRRNLWFCPKEVKTTAYITLVRPKLEYASCAWDPYKAGQIKKIEGVQRKAARFCMRNYKREASVTKMIAELGWETLEQRRESARLNMLHKIQDNLVGINKERYIKPSQITATRTRKQKAEVPFARKDVFKYSFFPRTLKKWNSMGEDTVNLKQNDDTVNLKQNDDTVNFQQNGDTVDFKQKDTVDFKQKDTVDFKQKDTVDFKQKDTVDFKQKDTVDFKQKDTVDFKQKDTVDFKQKDTVDFKQKDTVVFKQNDTVDSRQEDTVDFKQKDTVDFKQKDTIDIKDLASQK